MTLLSPPRGATTLHQRLRVSSGTAIHHHVRTDPPGAVMTLHDPLPSLDAGSSLSTLRRPPSAVRRPLPPPPPPPHDAVQPTSDPETLSGDGSSSSTLFIYPPAACRRGLLSLPAIAASVAAKAAPSAEPATARRQRDATARCDSSVRRRATAGDATGQRDR